MSSNSTVCSGCGKRVTHIGNHVRYDKTCTAEQRFWGKIKKGRPDECWLWIGAVNTTGYGMVSWDGKKNIVAHRKAYELLRGPIPAGMHLLHRCDTPRCCNPGHMFFGTDADNVQDMIAKGRDRLVGARSATAKLTAAQVLWVRENYKRTSYKNSNAAELAAAVGVTPGMIHAIVQRKNWRSL